MKLSNGLLAAVGVVALAGLYLLARPQAPVASAPMAAAAPSVAPPLVTAREYSFEVVQGKVRGPAQMPANLGERVTLRVRSDVADELHVHGYELSAPLPAGEPVALTFVAARSGRFEVELHGAHRQLGALEVQPR